MAGEMTIATRDEWPIHYAIAEAVGGEVKPFDYYQGPYIVVGPDLRVGGGMYHYLPQHLGIVRLWLVADGPEEFQVYREDTDTVSDFCIDEVDAVIAAQALLQDNPDG